MYSAVLIGHAKSENQKYVFLFYVWQDKKFKWQFQIPQLKLYIYKELLFYFPVFDIIQAAAQSEIFHSH